MPFRPVNNFRPANFRPAAMEPDVGRHFTLYRLDPDGSRVFVATAFPDPPFAQDLKGLLPPGEWTIARTYTDEYGSESDPDEMTVLVDEQGNVYTRLRELLAVEAEPLAGGRIRVRWSLVKREKWMHDPVRFDLARVENLDNPLTTVNAAAGTTAYQAELGPFAHGQTVRLAVRAADDAQAGAWLEAPAVVADAEGPAPPQIL